MDVLEQYYARDKPKHDDENNNTDNTFRNKQDEIDVNDSNGALKQEGRNVEQVEV